MLILMIILIACASLTLVFLANREFLGQNYNLARASLLGKQAPSTGLGLMRIDQSFFYTVGRSVFLLVPAEVFKKLEFDHLYLGRAKEQLYISIGQAVMILFAFMVAFYCSANFMFMFLALLVPASIIFEVSFAIDQYKKSIEKAIPHMVECLKVLVVNTETPLVTALDLIVASLPQEFKAMKQEMLKLVRNGEKAGMRDALLDWQTDSPRFKDFISLLVSINEGSSKAALKVAIENFITRAKEDEEEALKDRAENLQLYLMGPVVLILLVMLYPMMAAIQYMLQAVNIG